MRNFRTVFEFEFFQQIKKKAVIVSTILLAIVAFGGAAAPGIINHFNKPTEFDSSEGASISTIVFLVDTLYRMKRLQKH